MPPIAIGYSPATEAIAIVVIKNSEQAATT